MTFVRVVRPKTADDYRREQYERAGETVREIVARLRPKGRECRRCRTIVPNLPTHILVCRATPAPDATEARGDG